MRANGDPIRASSATYTTSHAEREPEARAERGPCTAANVGTASSARRATTGFSESLRIASPSSLAGSASARSRPAQKPRPSPRTTSARTPRRFDFVEARVQIGDHRLVDRVHLVGTVQDQLAVRTVDDQEDGAAIRAGRHSSYAALVIAVRRQDLELARADRVAVLVEDVPAVHDDSGRRRRGPPSRGPRSRDGSCRRSTSHVG